MDKNRRQWALFIGVLATALLIWTPSAHGTPFFKPDLPDFYQHQKSGPKVNVPGENLDFDNPVPRPATVPSYDLTTQWWENGGGWCCVTAFVDSFYYLEKHFGYDGFFTRTGGEGKTWQEQMVFAIEDFAKDLILDSTRDIPEYVRKLEAESAKKIADAGGQAKSSLSYSEFFLSSGKVMMQADDGKGTLLPPVDVSKTFGSLFDVYHNELCRSEDVTVRLTDPNHVTGAWWSPSFHVVAGAGVQDCTDKAKRTLWFSDPDKRHVIQDGKYIADRVREPYPAGADVPLPIGETNYEMVTVNDMGEITDGLYKGAFISEITAISPIPEPTAFVLMGSGLAIVVVFGRRRRLQKMC